MTKLTYKKLYSTLMINISSKWSLPRQKCHALAKKKQFKKQHHIMYYLLLLFIPHTRYHVDDMCVPWLYFGMASSRTVTHEKYAPTLWIYPKTFSNCFLFNHINQRTRSVVDRDLRLKTKDSRFESSHYPFAEVSSLQ